MSRILIIEDNETLSNAYKVILEEEGHKVDVAFNGNEGLEKLLKLKADVVLLDILMPGLTGIEVIREFNKKITKDSKGKKPIIIVLSNLNEDQEVHEALELGAYKYILKANTSPHQLALQVNHLIEKF